MSKPAMLMIKKSVKSTKDPKNPPFKMYLGYVDLSFESKHLKKFTSLYKDHFSIKDYPLSNDLIAYSQTNHTVVISLFLKELPGESVESFLFFVTHHFNVVYG